MILPASKGQASLVRPGFTILEIILVLALIVLVAAMAVPAFEGWFQAHRLREGVDEVRTHWIKARTQAMDEGRPYRFAWMPGGGGYRVAPHDLEHWSDLPETSASVPFSESGQAAGLVVEKQLPEGVQFSSGDGLRPDTGSWSEEVILFWPDGTARIFAGDGSEKLETHLFLADQRGRAAAMHLRGLTGVVTVFNVK